MSLGKINDISKRKENYINSKVKTLDKEVLKLQDKLLSMVLSDYIPKFTTDNTGNIKLTKHNIALIYEIDKIFSNFNKLYQNNVIKKYAEDLLKLTPFNEAYYIGLGIEAKTVDNLVNKSEIVKASIGVDAKGRVIKGSYLDDLSQNAEVKKSIKNYVIESVNSKRGLKDYTKGLKTLIVGNEQVDGKLQRYYKQYAYDTFNQVDAAQNLYVADNLGLQAFIYAGTIILTSRQFCKDRVGKVFTREEGQSWNKLKWQGQKKPANFFIDRGGYG